MSPMPRRLCSTLLLLALAAPPARAQSLEDRLNQLFIFGEGDEALKDKINSLVLQGRKKLVLNLADVPYIDSAGLGEIVRTFTTVSRQGGSLKLLSLTKRITDLLSITKLLTVFETFDSESDALKSYS